MANAKTVITITHGNEGYQTIVDRYLKPSSKVREEMVALRGFFHAAAGGDRSAKAVVQVNSGDEVLAKATVTVLSAAIGDTAVVSGTTFTAVNHKETSNVTFGADVSGSLNSKYFTFQDQSGGNRYYLWFSINSAGVDPKPAGYAPANGIKVSGATNVTAAALATAAIAACVAFNGATGPVGVKVTAGASTHAIFTAITPGVCTALADGAASSTGFSISRTITGSAVTSVQYDIGFTDTDAAANLAAAINAKSTLAQVATATSAAAVTTVSSFYPGPIGNLITLTATTGNTASGSTLSGGTLAVTSSAINTYRSGV